MTPPPDAVGPALAIGSGASGGRDPAPAGCAHCGAAVEASVEFCCSGCEHAAAIIRGAGLERYYADRSVAAPRPEGQRLAWRDLPLEEDERGTALRFSVDGLRCASCVWVTERVLQATPGVLDAHVSYATGRAIVHFDPNKVGAEAICGRIADIGYAPRPVEAVEAIDHSLMVRFGVSAFLTANVMGLSAAIYAGWLNGMDERYRLLFHGFSLVLSTPVAFYGGAPFFERAWGGLRHGAPSMDLPVAIGIAVMWVQAVVGVASGADVWLDSLGMLVTLLLAGRMVEARGRRQASEAAASLAARLPSRARRVTSTGVEDVDADALAVGDRVEIGVGEEISADGTVERGAVLVRMALLTGESEPTWIRDGGEVVAGASVVEGSARVRVDRVGDDRTVARMTRWLGAADERPEDRGVTDRLAPWFTVGSLVIAAAVAGYTSATFGADEAVRRTVAVLVVACPCALALAQPVAVAAGLGAAARRGLLLRSGTSLLRLGQVDRISLDKTGTLTGGVPVLVEASDAALRVAAGLERYSRHPLASAVLAAAAARQVPVPDSSLVLEQAGKGIDGVVDGQRWSLRAAAGANETALELRCEDGRSEILRFRDEIRADASRALSALVGVGVAVNVLSGDNAQVARRLGAQLGIDAEGGLDPEAKRRFVADWRAEGHRVAFVGDGLNDGPALAAADVGLAMAAGVPSSVKVADGVVVGDGLGPLVAGVRAGRAASLAIRANLIRSLIYNVSAVGFAAAGYVNPLVAAVLMPLSSALVLHGALGVERRVAAEERSWTASSS
jgi:Cu2+-exporting ATPase